MTKRLLSGLLIVLSLTAKAQFQIGNSISNYSGVNGLYLNASSIADSRFKFHANLVGFGQHLSNDYISWQGPYTPMAAAVYGLPFLGSLYKVDSRYVMGTGSSAYVDVKDEYLVENLNGKPKNAFVQTELRLPSFMFNINKDNAVAISSRMRTMVQLTNVTEPLARMMYYGFDTTRAPFRNGQLNAEQLYSNNSFNINTLSFAEIAATYARTVIDLDQHYIKGGITVKRFIPVYASYIRNQSLDVTVYNADSLSFNNTGIEYGYVNEKAYIDSNGNFNPDIKPFDLGGGYGFDIGFTYEFRRDIEKYTYKMDGKTWKNRGKNKYFLKLSAALNDIGSVKFKNDKYVRSYKLASKSDIVWDQYSIDMLGYYDSLYNKFGVYTAVDSVVQNVVGFESSARDFKMKLPASFNINADFNVYRGFYLNVLWIQTLRSKDVTGLRGFSLLSVTPRYESRWFDVSLPITLTQDYKKLRTGLCLRGGPLYIGTDNLSSFYSKKNVYGTDIYFGVTIPIHRKKHKDRDNDEVSNKLDQCKNVKGVWEFRGCPDTDADGIPDSQDSCYDVAGKKELNGCPDRDDDGIVDAKDECPDVAGLPAFMGCPDVDGDGIADKDDACPELAGPALTKGCPDRDNDGILDPDDACPDAPGLLALAGCPDRDNDGVADKNDKCPDTKGLVEMAGCPDTDGDGIADNVDLCPLEKGLPENNGCPKVEEKIDLVEITEEEQEVLKDVFENLEFATGKSEIQPSSFASLDELVKLMEKRPEYRIYIAGHTDNVGNKTANLKLSQERAEAVKKYLVSKGIDPSRIKTEGFGMERPVVSNDTPEGKQKNRRVEFRVIK